jgi:hypothetical protein
MRVRRARGGDTGLPLRQPNPEWRHRQHRDLVSLGGNALSQPTPWNVRHFAAWRYRVPRRASVNGGRRDVQANPPATVTASPGFDSQSRSEVFNVACHNFDVRTSA